MNAKRQSAALLTGINSPIAVLHPGGAQNPGATMLDKRWPADRFAELARVLHHDGTTVLLSGGMGDLGAARYVADKAGLEASAILAGQIDIETLTGVINRAAIYVGPDTGVTHIAAAVGTPTIAIFGPTNPRRYRPLGRHVQVLAPPESWEIPDRDLRRNSGPASRPSTEAVSIETVLAATRDVISRGHGLNQCDR
jgi:heptosyltransferase-2/heptosyltransferase-3